MSVKDVDVTGYTPMAFGQTITSAHSVYITTLTRTYTSPEYMQTAAASATATSPMAAIQTLTDAPSPPDWYCTAALPAGGIIVVNDTFSIKLGEILSFQAPCGNYSIFGNNDSTSGNSTVISFGDPFYSSVAPQFFALATATVLSYLLLIILFITPRTFYVGGPGASSAYNGGASGFLGRGMTFIGSGVSNSSVIGVGRRPMLQKIAALLVTIALTIATADTFNVAETQYNQGYMDSKALVRQVVGSTEVRVTRVISATFLWLAQVQTLIRLFPRHKEKVTIKWLGFGLVICDTVFSILENFVSQADITRPRSLTDAIPALSYLFELSISLIYASCVVYYCLSKRRFAFWSSKMKSMCVMALLSLAAVFIPVVFFIVDVVQPDVATWGEYIRWVGAAAASVVVWEWVERIEALERDERKDGILGREVFDGDEMLDSTYSNNHNRRAMGRSSRRPSDDSQKEKRSMWKDVRDLNLSSRIPPLDWNKHARRVKEKAKLGSNKSKTASAVDEIARPPQVATPVNRADTTSASTVYAVRHHDPFSPSPMIQEEHLDAENPHLQSDESTLTNNTNGDRSSKASQSDSVKGVSSGRQVWHAVAHPFKRKRAEPPAEVAAQIEDSNARRSPATGSSNYRARFHSFGLTSKSRAAHRPPQSRTPQQVTIIPARPRGRRASHVVDGNNESSGAQQASLNILNESVRPSHETVRTEDLPVMVIPAPSRGGRTWSPDDLYHHSAYASPPRQDTNRTLRFEDSPQVSSENNGQPTNPQFNSPARDRARTVTSISDRLSTSPGPRTYTPSSGLTSPPPPPSNFPTTTPPHGSNSTSPSAARSGTEPANTPGNNGSITRPPTAPQTQSQNAHSSRPGDDIVRSYSEGPRPAENG